MTWFIYLWKLFKNFLDVDREAGALEVVNESISMHWEFIFRQKNKNYKVSHFDQELQWSYNSQPSKPLKEKHFLLLNSNLKWTSYLPRYAWSRPSLLISCLFSSLCLDWILVFINVAENRKIKRKENLTFSLVHRQSYITLDDDS